MARDIKSEGSKALDQVEHNSDASAKRVVIRAQDPVTGEFFNVSAVANGDGTYGLSTNVLGAKATSAYSISNIEETGTYKYFGFEKADGGWYIMRKTLADNTFLYYAASSAYSTGWTDRATHTYVAYSVAF